MQVLAHFVGHHDVLRHGHRRVPRQNFAVVDRSFHGFDIAGRESQRLSAFTIEVAGTFRQTMCGRWIALYWNATMQERILEGGRSKFRGVFESQWRMQPLWRRSPPRAHEHGAKAAFETGMR